MKSFILFFSIISMSFVFSQENQDIALVKSKKELLSVKETGVFKLILPGQMTESDVSKCAGYYVHNFSVNYNYSSKEAVISMVTNDTKNRQVIVRFMKACGIRLINVEGQLLEIQDFYESYLK